MAAACVCTCSGVLAVVLELARSRETPAAGEQNLRKSLLSAAAGGRALRPTSSGYKPPDVQICLHKCGRDQAAVRAVASSAANPDAARCCSLACGHTCHPRRLRLEETLTHVRPPEGASGCAADTSSTSFSRKRVPAFAPLRWPSAESRLVSPRSTTSSLRTASSERCSASSSVPEERLA